MNVVFGNPFDLRSPGKSITVSFTSFGRGSTSGLLRIDHAFKCVDPTATAFKYIEHMRMRGWDVVVQNIVTNKYKQLTIVVRMSK